MFRMRQCRKDKNRPFTTNVPLHLEVRTRLNFVIRGKSDTELKPVSCFVSKGFLILF